MPLEKIEKVVSIKLAELKEKGTVKGKEWIITGIKEPEGEKGRRYLVEGEGNKEYLKMDSNSYLGMSLRKEVIEAEGAAAKKFGAGPGAVRFIHGTYKPHVELEKKLAEFHEREAGMIFSSAYATMCGILSPLISRETIVISDELNHNCIINAIRISRPKDKKMYNHLDLEDLETKIEECIGECRQIVIVTDGVFSMRGDYPDLGEIVSLAKRYDPEFEEGVLTVLDDSHGVGAFGKTGRGTPEVTGEDGGIDIIVSTMGKAMGVNGGYLVTSGILIEYLRETAPLYIYSNPITPSEARAAIKALEILDSEEGREVLRRLHELTRYFREGLISLGYLGYELMGKEHPIVPVMIRDSKKTEELVDYLKHKMILVVGLKYPVVPKGDESIRFQISVDHTKSDLDYVLGALEEYKRKC